MAAVMEKEMFDIRLLDPISTAELQRRWAAARAHMRAAGIDVLVTQSTNAQSGGGYVRWFIDQTNVGSNPLTTLFPADGLMTVVHQGPWGKERKFDGKTAPNRGIGKRVFTPSYPSLQYTGHYDADIVARETLKDGHKTVGLVCPATMYHSFGARLEELLKGVKVVDATDIIDKVKSVKSAEEIEIVRRCCAMQDEVMRRVAGHIKPGMKDFEVYAYAQYQGQLLGSQNGIFLGSSATPPEPAAYKPRSQMGREIRKGDVFMLLVENSGPGGYYAEIARPFCLGKAPQALKELVALVVEAQHNTVKRLKPGASLPEIWDAHNAFMCGKGKHAEERLHSHGQGYDLVERPLVRHDETQMKVEANMYFACHPEVATPQEFMTICDNFLVKADGTQEHLHKFPQEVIEI
ncbi:MAG: aminopeptidase P family protein [Betaproteobacteria bacterium]|nr:aminopeptidase P family protein [Betaproteobacteria bacterium]